MKPIWIILILILAALAVGAVMIVNQVSGVGSPSPLGSITPGLSSAKVVNLSGQGLTRVDTKIFDNRSIEELDLSNNNLTGALPSEIGKAKNLRILKAADNQLTGIPAEIGQLTKLETIDFSNNKIDTMPNELANLKNSLKTLNLSGNTYNADYQARIKAMLPSTNVMF
jgi:Leucine-rich repeat (LRR) protein